MVPFNALIIAIVLGAAPQLASPLTKHYTSSNECGFEFDYPANWVTVPIEKMCRVQLRPDNFAELIKESSADVYSLEVGREQLNFLEASSANFFDFRDGRWVLSRGHALDVPGAADVVRTPAWSGVRGWAGTRCYNEAGGYVTGICDEQALVLRDAADRVWSMNGGPKSQDAFDAILASFKFNARH
jgi:hypothetical protein